MLVSLTACTKSSDDETKTETNSASEVTEQTEERTDVGATLTTLEKETEETKKETTEKSKEKSNTDLDYVNSVIPPLSEKFDFKYFYNEVVPTLGTRHYPENLFSMCSFYFANYFGTEEYMVEKGTSGNYEYILYENGCANITAYNGKDKEIIVPEEIKGYKVAYIGEYAFEGNLRITKVVLPDTVLCIDTAAFSDCLFLKEIDLGDSLACLRGHTFYYCRFIKKIKLPDTLLYIGCYSFLYCTLLSEVEGGSSLKYIEGKTFNVVPLLDKLRLPEDVEIECDDAIAPNVKVEYY